MLALQTFDPNALQPFGGQDNALEQAGAMSILEHIGTGFVSVKKVIESVDLKEGFAAAMFLFTLQGGLQ